MKRQKERLLIFYLIKFIISFCALFYGTELIIGLSSPDNNYSSFVAANLDYVSPLRYALLATSRALLNFFDYSTYFKDSVTLSLKGGAGVRMVYSCIGYGVMSFWAAFIFANNGSWKKKGAWIIGGWAALYAINVVRISLLLVATNKHWPIPLGWDHHTWFNIVAYGLIFTLIYFFDKSSQQLDTQAAPVPVVP